MVKNSTPWRFHLIIIVVAHISASCTTPASRRDFFMRLKVQMTPPTFSHTTPGSNTTTMMYALRHEHFHHFRYGGIERHYALMLLSPACYAISLRRPPGTAFVGIGFLRTR